VTSSVALAQWPATVSPPAPVARCRRRAIPDTLPPDTRIGPWRVERLLGRGGMAAVYAVVHTGFGKRAALKLAHSVVLDSPLSTDVFLREARTVHMIDHPGTTDVFATGIYHERPYLVMERLVGTTLGHRLYNHRVDRDDALAILGELCAVLGAAHTAGIVHRDVKLDNVFLLDSPGRQIKLLDWGLARHLGEDDPLREMVAGTLTYVAPEQLRGEPITPATDVYSLGVIAYQLLCGIAPFAADDHHALIQAHLHQPPPPPTEDLPAPMRDLLVRMLAKNPVDRPTLVEIKAGLGARKSRKFSWLGIGFAALLVAALAETLHIWS
jgi:serine/threonine protein kinase